MTLTNHSALEWFWAISWLVLFGYLFLARFATRADRKAVKAMHTDIVGYVKRIEAAIGPLPEGDPYRTATRVQLPVVKAPVYCCDCRFLTISTRHIAELCDALPTGSGKWEFIGGPKTNAHHDCAHYQPKAKKP